MSNKLKYTCNIERGQYTSIIPYKGGLIKGGSYNHKYDLYYNDYFIASNVDTAPGIARLYSNLLFYPSNSKGYCFNLETFENKELESGFIFSTFYDNSYLALKGLDKNNWSYQLGLFQFEPSKLLTSIPKRHFGGIYRFNNLVINTIKNNNVSLLRSLSLLTGEYEWEIDLGGRYYESANEKHPSNIREIYGVIDDKLYVWMDGQRLVVLNVNNGNILSETFPVAELQKEYNMYFSLFPTYRETEKSLIFCYQGYIAIVDLLTLQTKLVWHDDRYNIGPTFITDDFIYFIGSYEKGALFRDHIGVFDRNKNEVVWMQKVIEINKQSYNNLKEIQATEDKIYTLDTEGNLYIFEKEITV